MLVIGLTGGIASGKTTVSGILKELGACVLDADRVGHEAYLPNTQTWREVVAAFGEEILTPDNEIDRGKLGALVFKVPANMKKLTDIMWPRMYDMVSERIEEQRKKGAVVMVVEAAVLLEAKWDPLTDEVWVAIAPERTVIERLRESKGMTEEQARDRINAQMSPEERMKRADVVIHNDSGLGDLREKVLEAWKSRVEQRK
ncbi:MAG: dephospho-CoA kinase [Chloroflexi bacterium]|nr:dephospho-CoA kinase [Chloroflexota bacterium]